MKIILHITLLFFSTILLGQNRFVGEFHKVIELKDTLEMPKWGYLHDKCFKINDDSSYFYYEEENPTAFDVSHRETFEGTWTSRHDTITFYNRNFQIPKGIKFKHKENQKFKGINIIVKDYNGTNLNIDWCFADSIISSNKEQQKKLCYNLYNKNKITVSEKCYTTIYFRPHGYCEDFRDCEIGINIADVKDGTLIEVICFSNEMSINLNGKQYILKGNTLLEIPTDCCTPMSMTDKLFRKK